MDNIIISKVELKNPDYEFVERKGLGHPDTLSDALAEWVSINYSRYTLQRYGAILHHNFDKIGLLGGSSYVKFGRGYMTSPIRVLLNGRVSTKYAEEKIPIKKLLTKWTKGFFRTNLPIIDVDDDLEFHYNLSNQSSPGKTYENASLKGTRRFWFEPRSLDDIGDLRTLVANDTSLGVGYAPYSELDNLVLSIESILNSKKSHEQYPWLGTDIKVMAIRQKDEYHLTVCIPQIADYVKNITEYRANLNIIKKIIIEIIGKRKIDKFELSLNTRDDYGTRELYFTATGSSIESGDEGLVGRGNRVNGLITPSKPMSLEGVSGKNPVYHIGKVYNVAANEISKKIFHKFGIENQIYIVGQTGQDLLHPWSTLIVVPESFKNIKLRQFVERELEKIPKLTKGIIQRKYSLY